MKFGKVDDPGQIDFTLPEDHPVTADTLARYRGDSTPAIYVGCAKWNRQDLKGFYPRGTKDELMYYATQFNSVEMNSTFYRIWSPDQVEKWRDKVPEDFKFFPKVFQNISHIKRLKDAKEITREYLHSIDHLGDRLGMMFLQMHSNYSPKEENMKRLHDYLDIWPSEYPLALELRHTDWYNDPSVSSRLYHLLESHGIANVITDTAGRRDLMHMRLTSDTAFIRYTGANHSTDYDRVIDWAERLERWIEMGLRNVYFFVHQNDEVESVNISRHFIKELNRRLGLDLKMPAVLEERSPDLFS